MDRAERDELRASLEGWKPRQHVEVRVDRLRALLDLCDELDRYTPAQHHLTALAHWRYGQSVDECACASCEGYRARARMAAGRDLKPDSIPEGEGDL